MSLRFDDRVAIVTGSGGGLGRSHALMLAAAGAKLVINDLGGAVDGKGGDSSAADKVVAEIKASGGQAVASYDSVSDPKSAQNMIDIALKAFGRVDILVNNAGILRDKSFAKMTVEDWDTVIAVHLSGTAYCTKAAWPVMQEQKYGRIVFTTSGSGIGGNYGQSNYSAAKTGMIGLMHCLNIEGAKNNINTSCIAPVAMTRMTQGLMPEQLATWLKPELISPAVVWMCHEQNTEKNLIINAGAGYFARVAFYKNDGVQLDPAEDISLDRFGEFAAQVVDMTKVRPYVGAALDAMNNLAKLGRIKSA
jgi:NAD(P)-dependent dehydrogenase (short-subunit alcohol dehydrogenase family)